jgi:hypothetical protein
MPIIAVCLYILRRFIENIAEQCSYFFSAYLPSSHTHPGFGYGGKTMPPSGFNPKAIAALLEFIRINYHGVQSKYQTARTQNSTLTEQQHLETTADALEGRVGHAFGKDPVIADSSLPYLKTLLAECYRDLAHEINAGQDKKGRPVHEGAAIDKELGQLATYLSAFTL